MTLGGNKLYMKQNTWHRKQCLLHPPIVLTGAHMEELSPDLSRVCPGSVPQEALPVLPLYLGARSGCVGAALWGARQCQRGGQLALGDGPGPSSPSVAKGSRAGTRGAAGWCGSGALHGGRGNKTTSDVGVHVPGTSGWCAPSQGFLSCNTCKSQEQSF